MLQTLSFVTFEVNGSGREVWGMSIICKILGHESKNCLLRKFLRSKAQ